MLALDQEHILRWIQVDSLIAAAVDAILDYQAAGARRHAR